MNSNFDFNQIRRNIEQAQEKTNKDLSESSQIPVPGGSSVDPFHGFNGNSLPKYDPSTHGSPDTSANSPKPSGSIISPEMKEAVFGVDIETYRNLELKEDYLDYKLGKLINSKLVDPVKIEANKKKKHAEAATNALLGRIILIGLVVNRQPKTMDWGMITDGVYYKALTAFDKPEKNILQEFWMNYEAHINSGYTLLSFNGKQFDLQYIVLRSIVNRTVRLANIQGFIQA